MRLVKNERKYWEFIRELRNDTRVKSGFIQQQHIEPEDHINFMMSNGELFYVCLMNDSPVGFVRVMDDDIGVCTHPNYQKRGVAKFMVEEIMKLHPSAVAKIKIGNAASIKLFEGCGFKKKYYLLERESA